MRTILVQPRASEWRPGQDNPLIDLFRLPPIGLLSIAGYLEQSGHEVHVYDSHGPLSGEDISDDAQKILAYEPEIVGITSTTSTFGNLCKLSDRIKSISPETLIAAGGVHVTSTGSRVLEENPSIDYLCIGEGEETMNQLASGRDTKEINGLVWRDEQAGVVTNPEREYISDLDRLPYPAYHKLAGFPEKYNLPLFNYCRYPGASILTSRGCPFKCTFCDRSVFKNRFRSNSPEYVYNHMVELKDRYNIRHISIYDDLFTVNRERITDICSLLIKKPTGIRFNCLVRVGNADRQLLEMLKKAGCYMVSLGIETGDPELIREHKPGVDLQGVRDTVEMIKQSGLRIKGLFIMGLPGESGESVQRTSDFIMSLGLDMLNVSKFSPFPGAQLWESVSRTPGFENNWDKLNCMNFVYLPEKMESKAHMEELYRNMIKRFYANPWWIFRVILRTWEYRHSILHFIKNLSKYLRARREFE